MNERFGEELSLEEILSDEEKAHDRFVRSAPGANFGPELTLAECLDILHKTALPPRAGFWQINANVIDEALINHIDHLEIGDYKFKIEYFARITSIKKFDFTTPFAYLRVPNGKGPHDTESRD